MMWFIIGTRAERKDFGGTEFRVCEDCGAGTLHILTLTRSWLTLFFIQLFVYQDVWELNCPACGHSFKVPASELSRVKESNRVQKRLSRQPR